MKAVVDKSLCIGCGLCANICPEVFSMDDDGLAVAIDQEIDDSLIDLAKEAEESCPVDAITVE
ncbi:ferredoxin [Clostridium sp. Cult2]|uniref:ferredoxin n=1 Tax=Clostridium sp. Cult2 TaxID=2079003 RepID=UPI001F347464|nr:ferredoxin [Clostridium sp. Cult2]MCF6466466.1 ferredoxin [Clostridium sp. Cult2]